MLITECVFIGYPFGIKVYKLLDLNTCSIFISKHVVFHENVFPLHLVIPSSSPHPFIFTKPIPDCLSYPLAIFSSDPSQASPLNDAEIVLSPPISPQTSPTPTLVSPPPLRCSTHTRSAPQFLQDFHCQ